MLLPWIIPEGIHADKCDRCRAGREIIRTKAEKESEKRSLLPAPRRPRRGAQKEDLGQMLTRGGGKGVHTDSFLSYLFF